MPHGEKGGLCSLTCLLHVSDLRQVGWDIELGCVFLCSLLLPDCSMFNLVYQTQYFIGPVIYMNFEPMTFGGGGEDTLFYLGMLCLGRESCWLLVPPKWIQGCPTEKTLQKTDRMKEFPSASSR